jgi:soluble cytochrome b562
MKIFVEKITKITEIVQVQKLLENNKIEENFQDLRNEYDSKISLLNFDDFKEFNTQEEDKILKGDILKLQETLVKKSIAEVLNEVTELYEMAQHNKNITRILMERIAAANSMVCILRDDDLASKDYTSLQRLVQVLQNMKIFVEKITKITEIVQVQKFLENNKIEENFQDLRQEYDSKIRLLKFDDFKEFNT